MVNQSNLLDRRPNRQGPRVVLGDTLALARARVHEACGPAKATLALAFAGCCEGAVLWIRPAWQTETLHPAGIAPWCDPTRILTLQAGQTRDILWAMEEALGSGAVTTVAAEVNEIPELTPVRRLHLAAERGALKTPKPPFGILLTPGLGGAPGVESRWYMAPVFAENGPAWHIERLRARMAPLAAWTMTRSTDSPTFHPTAPRVA